MKRWLAMAAALCLCLSGAACAEYTPVELLSYTPLELEMPAVQLKLYVPGDMDAMEGDEVAADTGYRFNCFSDTFDLSVWVHDSRDMDLERYAAFYRERYGFADAQIVRINGFAAARLTMADRPYDFTILLTPPDVLEPDSVYELSFVCDGQEDAALAEEIMGTLWVMD
jgi:hypothetical protein